MSHFLGTDYVAPVQTPGVKNLLAQLQNPNYGQSQLSQYAQSAYSSMLPQFNQQMQSTKEDAIRRGISTGDLGTSFEGDLTSAFQRNLANSISSQAMNLFGQRNSMLEGLLTNQQDAEQAAQNAHQQAKSGLMGGILGAAGSIFGGF